MKKLIEQFVNALLSMNRVKVRKIIKDNFDLNNPFHIIENLVVPASEIIGNRWAEGSVALSQVYMSSRIIEEFVDDILPPDSAGRIDQPVMAIAVLEDYHMLGKRIIYSGIRADGYKLTDYGRVTVEEAVEKVKIDSIEILLISTLMLPSALRIKDLRSVLDHNNLTPFIIVGGAPFRFDEKLWQEVGADATARDVSELLKLLKTKSESLS